VPTLSLSEIGELLSPYLAGVSGGAEGESPPKLLEQLSTYLELLMTWNQRMNLTSIRSPREVVQRHFGESLFAARHVRGAGTLLDLGSGAGFPGLPIQLWHPGLRVTLAESQGKKASFLREVARSLSVEVEVWARRAEEFPPERAFDAVILRAVDGMEHSLKTASLLSASDVWLFGIEGQVDVGRAGLTVVRTMAVPLARSTVLVQMRRILFYVEQQHGRDG